MQGITEQRIKAYFLGDMTAEDGFEFEMEFVTSAQLTDFVRAVETELVEDFVAGRLSTGQSEKFQANYLVTPARLERCRLAAGIRRLASERSIEQPVAPPIGNWFEHNVLSRKKFVTFLVGLCLLFLFGLLASVFFAKPVKESDVAAVEIAGPELPVIETIPETEQDQPAEDVIAAAWPAKEPVAKKSPVEPKRVVENRDDSAPTVGVVRPEPRKRSIVVKLMPGRSRGAIAQPVKLESDVDRVLVLLSPGGDPNKFRNLHATVKTPEDQTVYSSPELKSLSFTLDASKLENRTYIVTLEGQNSENRYENIARYTFMVSR